MADELLDTYDRMKSKQLSQLRRMFEDGRISIEDARHIWNQPPRIEQTEDGRTLLTIPGWVPPCPDGLGGGDA